MNSKRITVPPSVWRRLERLYKEKYDRINEEPRPKIQEFAVEVFISGLDAEELIEGGAL